jgi:dihydrodipicolinate synthase/N-acetylneuraminate lyase
MKMNKKTITLARRMTTMKRRSFLQSTLAGAPLALAAQISAGAEKQTKPAQVGESATQNVLDRMKGPMASITIPYNEDYSIDHGSLRGWVDFMCESKVPILFLTYGDSELYNLSEREVEAVIRTVARQAKGRSLVVGGTPRGWSGQTIDFINRLENSGVDAVNVHLYSKKEDEIGRALSQIAEKTRLPLLAYESNYSLELVKRIAQIPRMVGMKCHAELYRYYDFIRTTKDDQFGVLSAGQMKHFLFGYLIGSPAYLCPLTPFAPQVGLKFYEALKTGDIPEARRLIFEYEEPLLKVTIPLGYPNTYKSALYLTGHYRTNRMRPPKKTNLLSELKPLREFFEKKGFLKKS